MKAILFLIAFLTTTVCFANGYDTAIAILQAQHMKKTTGGTAQQDYWIQDINGGVYAVVNFPTTGYYRFDFTGHGTSRGKTTSQVWTNCAILIGATTKAILTINSKTNDIWTAVIYVKAGKHKVSFLLNNDIGGLGFKLFMALFYITPVVQPNSNHSIVYEPYTPDTLPTFGTAFLKRQNFSSNQLRGFAINDNWNFNNGKLQPSPLSWYDDMRAIGSNFVKILIDMHAKGNAYTIVYGGFDEMDKILHKAWQDKFYVNITISEDSNRAETVWGNEALKQSYVNIVEQVAERYKDSTEVACIALAGEPNVGDGKLGEWVLLAQRLMTAVRRYDTNHVIVMPFCTGTQNLFRLSEPLADNNVIYEFHEYRPYEITHQGINSTDSIQTEYPNFKESQYFDSAYLNEYNKDSLSASLQLLRDWCTKYNTPLMIGEFSCIDWTPTNSACRYVKDCIDLFEAEKWSWLYLTFRQYYGWDGEIPSDVFYQFPYYNAKPDIGAFKIDNTRTDTTCTMQTLQQFFKLNKNED